MKSLVVLCPVDAIEAGAIRKETLPDGTPIALYNVDGTIFATDDTCTHGAASLADDGVLEGKVVECSWHFGRFDVTTGEPCASPCVVPLKTYRVVIADGIVSVEIAAKQDS